VPFDTNAANEESRKNFNLAVTPNDNDTIFALKTLFAYHDQIVHRTGTQESLDKYERFVESLERDPKQKDMGFRARCSWLGRSSHFALSLPEEAQRLAHFNKTFEDTKKHIAVNADNPLLKYHVSTLLTGAFSWATVIESSSKTGMKKGTLVVPVLEYFNTVYQSLDDDFMRQDRVGRIWTEYYEREMEKYHILAANDQLVAFREAVEKFKTSQEKELSENLIQRLKGFEAITEEMNSRKEAAQWLYQTMCPVFADANVPAIKDHVPVIDATLNLLTLEGKEFELEAILLDGKKINLKDYRGKVVFLVYWHDKDELRVVPFLIGLSHNVAFQEKGLEIIAFGVDENVDRLKESVEDLNPRWQNASRVLSIRQNLTDSQEKYNINRFPTFVLIDRDGKVIRAMVGNDTRGLVPVGSVCQLGAEILSGNGRKQVESPKNQWRRMIKSV